MVKCLVLAVNSNEVCDLRQMTSPLQASVSWGVTKGDLSVLCCLQGCWECLE